jgi:acyl-CoA synthetase (NDP forming)
MVKTEISAERLRSLFRPRNVALVGASDKSAFSVMAYRNLVDFGFGEKTFLVNRRGVEVHGRTTVTSCSAIGEPVDVAFMMVPQGGTLDALSDAAAAGIRNAVILSSGYSETGPAGRDAQAELVDHAWSLDMIVLGPNHLGFANMVDQIPVTPVPGLPRRAGRVGLLSQSGASAGAMVDYAAVAGADLSYLVTLGNEAMITAGHALNFLVDDDSTDAIAIFMETVRQPEVFRAAAQRAAEAGKAIVILKAGSSELSARTAAAHTGALVGDDRAISTVFDELGIIRVDSIEDMMITAGTAAGLGRLARPGIGIVSISGGACDIVADRAEECGASLPELGEDTRTQLEALLPDYGTVQNPLDLTGAAMLDPSMFSRAIEIMSRDPAIGVVGVINSLPWEPAGKNVVTQAFANAIGAGAAQAQTPVTLINQVMLPITDTTRGILTEGQVPHAIPGLRQSVVALSKVAAWSDSTRVSRDRTATAPRTATLPEGAATGTKWSEVTAREVLSAAGIPVVPAVVARSAQEALSAAQQFGCPVALKIASPDILHKSDIGGVKLNVEGAEAVGSCYEEIITAVADKAPDARIEGVLVSPMRPGGLEMLVGVVRDPDWGLMMAVAFGGVFVEVLNDSALATLPVSPARARQLLAKLRGAQLFDGIRGTAPTDIDTLAQVISKVGVLAQGLGDPLESLEINPLRVEGSQIEALDAVVTWTTNQ